MKRSLSLTLALVMAALLLAGCGHEHTWVEATCTEPKTCSECKETEGEPLGHDWKAATCTEPKTCKRCGETEGEPLGHDWKAATCTEPEICARCGEKQGEPLGHTPLEADYWTPSLCAVCGEELGPVLTPGFEQHGLVCNMVPGVTYDYVATCYDNAEMTTVGKATILNYQTAPAIENYEAVPGTFWNFESREGYEWRFVTVQVVYDDENARRYGWTVGSCNENYYDIEHHDDTMVYDEEEHDYGSESTFDLVYKGEHYDCRKIFVDHSSGWVQNVTTYTYATAYQVPVGYDGCVVGLWNRTKTWDDGMYIYDMADADSLFFRMN